MNSSIPSASGASYSFAHSMSIADDIKSQQKHKMLNPVTPDISPPPSGMSQFVSQRQPQGDVSSQQPNDMSQFSSAWQPKVQCTLD